MSRRLGRVVIWAGLIFAIGLFAVPKSALAHGTGYRQSDKESISLEFYYSTGETMSYLDTKVFSPKDEKFAFQSGRTDEDGRFAFTPNTSGRWLVVVKDEEGHLAEAKIDVTEDFLDASGKVDAIVEKTAMPEGMDLAVRSALGVSLLFNIAALTSLVRRRKPAGEAN
jgi:nickel transport protein